MSLTTTVRNRLMDSIHMAVDAIGTRAITIGKTEVDTRMPPTKRGDNTAPAAYEYFIWSHVLARVRAKFESAKKRAISVGIIFDHTEEPRAPGTNEQIYVGEHVAIWLSVRNPAITVSAKKMRDFLIEKGVDEGLVNEAYEQASTPARPAHDFKVSLVAAETPVEPVEPLKPKKRASTVSVRALYAKKKRSK